MEESRGVKLRQTQRRPALRMLKRLSGIDHVEHKVEISGVDEVLLHPDQRYETVVRQQDSKHDILHFPSIPDHKIIVTMCDNAIASPDDGF